MGAPPIEHHRIRVETKYQEQKMSVRGTTFCKTTPTDPNNIKALHTQSLVYCSSRVKQHSKGDQAKFKADTERAIGHVFTKVG